MLEEKKGVDVGEFFSACDKFFGQFCINKKIIRTQEELGHAVEACDYSNKSVGFVDFSNYESLIGEGDASSFEMAIFPDTGNFGVSDRHRQTFENAESVDDPSLDELRGLAMHELAHGMQRRKSGDNIHFGYLRPDTKVKDKEKPQIGLGLTESLADVVKEIAMAEYYAHRGDRAKLMTAHITGDTGHIETIRVAKGDPKEGESFTGHLGDFAGRPVGMRTARVVGMSALELYRTSCAAILNDEQLKSEQNKVAGRYSNATGIDFDDYLRNTDELYKSSLKKEYFSEAPEQVSNFQESFGASIQGLPDLFGRENDESHEWLERADTTRETVDLFKRASGAAERAYNTPMNRPTRTK